MQASVSVGLSPGRRACSASVPPESYLLEREPLINVRGEACALRERRSLGRVAATNACIRNSRSAQRSPAARRPGPRWMIGLPWVLSAPLRLRASAFFPGFASLRLCAFALCCDGYLRHLRADTGRLALCRLCVSVSLWFCPEHRPHTQKASTRKQKPSTNSPQASPASSKKPRALISNGCDISVPPFGRNFGFRIFDRCSSYLMR